MKKKKITFYLLGKCTSKNNTDEWNSKHQLSFNIVLHFKKLYNTFLFHSQKWGYIKNADIIGFFPKRLMDSCHNPRDFPVVFNSVKWLNPPPQLHWSYLHSGCPLTPPWALIILLSRDKWKEHILGCCVSCKWQQISHCLFSWLLFLL